MKEELIVSGKHIPEIYPVLHLWHWEISLYLFLGGLAGGILFFAAYFFITGKEKKMPTTVKLATFIAPLALAIGLSSLLYDLHHKLYFWRLFTTVRFTSPMSWGAWTLMIIFPLSLIWIGSYMKEMFPKWDWKFNLLNQFEALAIKYRLSVAWAMMFLSIILAVYTGILLSAFNARPLWNTSILGPLFLVSGFSTGLAAIMWLSDDEYERKVLSRIDIFFILTELFLIVHLFMGFMAGTAVKLEAFHLFIGGSFTISFWVFVVLLGLVFPVTLEILELKGYRIPKWIPPLLILFGGLMFRFVMVDAGQITRFLY